MAETAVLWLLIFAFGCAATLYRPLFGLLTYLYVYYTNPSLHWWGEELPPLRWSYCSAILTAVSYLVHGSENAGSRVKILAHPQAKWLLALSALTLLLTPHAVSPSVSMEYAVKLLKVVVLYILFAKILTTLPAYRRLLQVHVLGGFFWGLEAFFDPETEGGRLTNLGGPDSDTGDTTAAHLLTILPFVGYYAVAGRGWERVLCFAAAPFVVNTLVMINSRGSILALAVAGVVAIVLGWRSHRGPTLLGVAAGIVALLVLSGPKFWERQATTLEPKDKAALSRLDMWKAGAELMKDHPLGAGGHGYDLLSPVYLPEEVQRKGGLVTVHNTYLMAGSEWGLPGLALLLLYLLACMRELHRLRTGAARTPIQERVQLEALAMTVAFVGYLTAGFFVNRFYAEATYWLGGLTAALRTVWDREERHSLLASDRAQGASQGREA